ncbi:MAG: nitrophenyl compound nitroreductase subunit ArsF family protein, partial [Bacteroidales bacterium]|nr:nitrophenyl compound nitroreductase subunit ArsF family protein [Bacteroidales bacterium]
MKKIGFFMLAAMLLTGSLFSGNAMAGVNEPAPQDKKVTPTEVYYFHMTRRCATCQAVESVTEAAVKEYFADALQKGIVTFKSVNLEEKANKSLVKKMKISGQALLVINGDER